MNGICSKTIYFLLLSFLLFSCKNETSSKASSLVSSSSKPEIVSIRLSAKAKSLNPFFAATSAIDGQIVGHLFPFLINYDPKRVKLEPVLAKSLPEVKENEDGSVSYTYEILDEAVWDNGTPVVGEDYIFSLKALMNPKVSAAAYRGGHQLHSDQKRPSG